MYSLYKFSRRFVGRFVYGLYSLYTFLYFSWWNATRVCMYYPAPRKQTSATRPLQVRPRRRWPRVGVVASTGVRPTRLVTLKTKQPARRTAATIAPSFATAHGPFHYHVRLACICQDMNIADRALLHVVTHAHDASFEPTRANLTPSP